MPRRLHTLRSWFLLSLLGSLSFAQAAPSPPQPQWIWRNAKPRENEILYFRTTFDLEGPESRNTVRSAVVAASCDDALGLFVNGRHLAEHSEWQQPLREDVTKHLRPGKNVLGFRGRNGADFAGLLVELRIEFADGRRQTITSDASWRVTDVPGDTWQRADYDDRAWQRPHSFGPLGVKPWGLIAFFAPPTNFSTPVSAITVPAGFQVELLYSVPKDREGSWVALTTDAKGRLIAADQDGGLFRVTVGDDAAATKVEKLAADIGQAQGLLYAFDSLYVMVNGSAAQGSGLYRLRDTNADDQFDEVKLLKKLDGFGEHGPHAIRLGPDGRLWVVVGNHTNLPEGVDPSSPVRHYAEDHLLPRNPDGRGHATGRMAPGGWIARTDADGRSWEIVSAGFRNPYDIAFGPDGELFTFDADMEWDTGAPWYRPTRVNHCVAGAEFGWRYGTGKWPDYYADSVGSVVDIGLGSPTGIEFGTGAKFPAAYQRALFLCDWTYGRMYAAHLQPAGGTYTATFETFLQGRPLPLTDVVIHRDGRMYFTVGGRKTQSGLYRVSYVGNESTAPIPPPPASAARDLRRRLETWQRKSAPDAVAALWSQLDSPDRSLRFAARVALENQDRSTWQERALAEPRSTAAIHALLALARVGSPSQLAPIVRRLNKLPFERLTEEQLLAALRAYALAFIRLGQPDDALAAETWKALDPLFPSPSVFVNRELCQVLTYLNTAGQATPRLVDRTLALLAAAETQQDQFAYVFTLRNARTGWTLDQRRAYFGWLALAEEKYRGGASFQKFVQQVRLDAVAKLTDREQTELADAIEGKSAVTAVKIETTRQFVHNWQMDDLLPLLDGVEKDRSFERGKAAYEAAQCAKCHRFAGAGGDTGPDITGVGNRFNALYLLESLLLPSKVVSDQYKNTILQTVDGEVLTGRVIEETSDLVRLRTDPFARALVTLPKNKIEARQPSPVSEMPQGLVNVLTKDEVLDLIAYLRSAGNARDKAFSTK